MSSIKEWAKKEIDIAIERERGNKNPSEWDYGCACYASAYKAFQSLLSDNHSGFSIGITMAILNRLIDRKPLTPIEDVSDIWTNVSVSENIEYTSYQCKRMSSLFKDIYKSGAVKYTDTNRFRCINKDKPNDPWWSNGFVANFLNELYPIAIPYCPSDKPILVHCTECLSNPNNGDFDTIGIWYIDKPDGTRDVIERFFAESDDTFIEISREEYEKRLTIGGAEDA